MSNNVEDDRIIDIPKYSEYSEKIRPEQLSLFEGETRCRDNKSLFLQDETVLISDIFKGNRACCKPGSLMKTQRAEGGEITWTREELYDRKSLY